MRCASVHYLKSPRLTMAGKKRKQPRPEPKPGSKVGKLYRLLQANKGKPVALDGPRAHNEYRLNQLRDFYGLDIRLTKGIRKHGNRIPEYTLVGEWFGKVYIDYTVDATGE